MENIMLKLTYTKQSIEGTDDVTVLGDVEGIRDLYWVLTHSLKMTRVKVTNLDGTDITDTVMHSPYLRCTNLSTINPNQG